MKLNKEEDDFKNKLRKVMLCSRYSSWLVLGGAILGYILQQIEILL